MLVDTGASEIVLSNDDARTLGLLTDGLQYEVLVYTASGTSVTAPVTLDIVSVGPIKRRAIQALVSPAGELRQSLLGMSFISTLKSFQMKSDELRFED
ncbi:clan AA aspartic protease (TIGR02281 family) [Neorhizobium sp. 2083]|nr:clan AA aspartic protease (TIGR02281 family) [Neorhizobium sp. 2083]